jgi:DNA-directed RNA polymerase subunit RPC12/RpoP
MLAHCPECSHKLWMRLGNIGAFRTVVFLDAQEGSDTYAEKVDRCPECGLWLHALGIRPAELAPRQ